ncbi:hypothetical protein DFH11DRAFT_204703 [Phellopilus nigrolimitatus]|nr:hypothetical protein DFH11DRAFT_204703 [Phellopilus nigrolimitatus]
MRKPKAKPYRSVKLASLTNHEFTYTRIEQYSSSAGELLFGIIPEREQGITDDLSHVGLTFKFLKNHPNLTINYDRVLASLKNLANGKAERITGSNAHKHFEASKNIHENFMKSPDNLELAEDAPTQTGKRSVKPRPVFGKQSADVDVNDALMSKATRKSSDCR